MVICILISLSPGVDKPYQAIGGIYRDEAIMLLRRFYIQENEKGKVRMCAAPDWRLTDRAAPIPKPKKERRLNTVIETKT